MACPPRTELLMLLPGSINSGFSCPSEPVLVPRPHAPALCGAAWPRATGSGAHCLPLHPAPNGAGRTVLGGEGPRGERQCPFLLPAMQTETEKDQIPKFLFKPRRHGPRWRHGDRHLLEGLDGPGAGHGSVWRAVRDKGAELPDGPAATGTGVRPSSRCIPGPKAWLCRPGSRRRPRQLAHQASPTRPRPRRGFQSSGAAMLHMRVVLQAGLGEAGAAGAPQGTMGVTTCPSLQMTPRQRAAAGMAPPP